MSSSSPSKARKSRAKKAVLSAAQSVVDKTIATMARQSDPKKKKNKNKNKNKKSGGAFTSTVDRRDYSTIVHINDSWGEVTAPSVTGGLHCLAVGNINPSLPYKAVTSNFKNNDFLTQGSRIANAFDSGFLTRTTAQCNPFDQWSGDDINISYNHRAGEFSDAGKSGEIVIAYQPNSNEGLPTSTTDLDNMRWRVSTIPCKDCVLRLPASLFRKRKYTRVGSIPATAAIDDYDSGRILIFAYGLADAAVNQMLGEIKITGTLRMFEATMSSQQTSQQVPAPKGNLTLYASEATMNALVPPALVPLTVKDSTNMIGVTFVDGATIRTGESSTVFRMPPGYFRVTQCMYNKLTTTGIGDITVYTTFANSHDAVQNFTCSNSLTNLGVTSQTIGGHITSSTTIYSPATWDFNVALAKFLTGLASDSFANGLGPAAYVINIQAL